MPVIRHAVYFWLKNPGSAEDRDALIHGIGKLAAIEEVQSLAIGIPAQTTQRDVVDASFDVSELMTFTSVAAQNAYQKHPIHDAFVKECSHLWSLVQVYDTQDVA